MALDRPPQAPPPTRPAATRLVRTGWVLVALLPVAFVAASVLGDWLLSVQGHDSGESSLPWSVVLKAGAPAVLVLVAPPALAAWCGRTALRRGDERGRPLVVVGLTAAIGLTVLNLAPLVVSVLG